MSKLIKELLPLGVTLLGIGYLAFNWSALPELVPMHFGLLGQPDGWAPKSFVVFLPFIALFLYGNLNKKRGAKLSPGTSLMLSLILLLYNQSYRFSRHIFST